MTKASRIEWETDGFKLPEQDFLTEFNQEIASALSMDWQIHYSDKPPKAAIFVTKDGHCLYDLLSNDMMITSRSQSQSTY